MVDKDDQSRKEEEEEEEDEGQLTASTIADDQEIDFVTLGMLIIDDIEYAPPKPPVRNVLGGAGTYAALGARLLSPAPTQSKRVGWIVDRGSDFPAQVTSQIESWQTSALVRDDPSRLTTRGWNGYDDPSDPDRRAFHYVTPKKRLTPDDLAAASHPALLAAAAVHICSGPARCREVVESLRRLRRAAMGDAYRRALVVWEPVPDLCTVDELIEVTKTLPLVDVCSPNHAELASLMGDSGPGAGLTADGQVDTEAVERSCVQLMESMPMARVAMVVRAGPSGCFVTRGSGGGTRRRRGGSKKGSGGDDGGGAKVVKVHGRDLQAGVDFEALFSSMMRDDDGRIARDDDETEDDGEGAESEIDPGVDRWLPAFFQPEDAAAGRIVDPTGGGNTFLGGLTVALGRGKAVEDAAVWASVAASFAIEQIGMPSLGVDSQGIETWNGVRVSTRLEEYSKRLGLDPKDYVL
ncbi:hypothetical protein MCOR25_005640 [Pyricularia grisea]|uniref:Carbohydrate kinase PfkB domain-containing protein n=1 Tax=Pyricularia grisea TaxID=148305 RepID=A0A6P8BAZ1_PYRGI|nr:uncharacterized protein PgNI_03726 [Pyricularia grisea]KAI6364509.1 hypothetical protein MCOR25_005640 [Pyricularia grisea]TLD13001.1 hypothetical protein PgNI_03726 [Pyricularia grisea]